MNYMNSKQSSLTSSTMVMDTMIPTTTATAKVRVRAQAKARVRVMMTVTTTRTSQMKKL